MHKLIFYFINEFKKNHLNKLNKNVSIIYRNYNKTYNESEVLEIKKYCLLNNRYFFIANDLHLANKLNLDGVYIPSFNKDLSIIKNKDKRLKIIGSAHNYREIQIKKSQKVDLLFISPLFKTKKSNNFLNIYRFNILSKFSNQKVIALGGINEKNMNKIKLINCNGFAAITYFDELK